MRRDILMLAWLLVMPAEGWAEDIEGTSFIQHLSFEDLQGTLPTGTQLLVHPAAIEKFLDELDGSPPDWALLYGEGHHDPGLDERLFSLNRERDARRAGHEALGKLLAFVWIGELSRYDAANDSFSVALGPKFVRTRWGMVRFKPEEVPGNLRLAADVFHRDQWRGQVEKGRSVEIDVVMSGTLIPDESIVYDFSHEEEGLGLIMPFVRIGRFDFVILTP
jgi:hypothetical protein